MYRRLLENHILSTLTLALVLLIGWTAYYQMPREQDPSVNFNWIQVWTYWPDSSALDVERRITTPLEEAIGRLSGIKFVSSTSREGVSSLIVRFADMPRSEFDKHAADLRREIQSQLGELPSEVEQPDILEISSSNAFPTATIVVSGQAHEEQLQQVARKITEDLERLPGVDSVATAGRADPELQVHFLPERLLGLGVTPVDLADAVRAYFQDVAAGNISIGNQKWMIRVSGTSTDPAYVGSLPIATSAGEIPIRSVAQIARGRAESRELVQYLGKPAVLLTVFKAEKANNLELLDQIKTHLAQQNSFADKTGVTATLLDDQTQATRSAISVMERNALIGLLLVGLVTWLALGLRIAAFTVLGIPFVLAGTFWLLSATGQTLNVTVLLAIVISLGMLVDDAIVVVEAIFFQLQRGKDSLDAALAALNEVGGPVTTAVLTTIAAFLPLMLMPGLLGDFMRVVPIVVSVALLVSLVEAFWMLPSHLVAYPPKLIAPGRMQATRQALTGRLRRNYVKWLVRVLRRPQASLIGLLGILAFSMALFVAGLVKVDFFATDLYRFFYVNVEMPPGTTLQKTGATLAAIDAAVRNELGPERIRGTVSYAGQQFTETEVLTGDERGQVFVSLSAEGTGDNDVEDAIGSLRQKLASVPGPIDVSFVRRKTGPPTAEPINVKVRGDDIEETRRAVAKLKDVLRQIPGVKDIADDDTEGGMQLNLRLNPDAVTRAALDPAEVSRAVRLFANGEVVASTLYLGETLDVRVRALPRPLQDVGTFLKHSLGLDEGGEMPLGALTSAAAEPVVNTIRHYNFRRTVTVTADLDTAITDTLKANARIQDEWAIAGGDFPGVALEFSGELDDIQESLGAMALLFLVGLGLIYLLLGTQFKSYLQPILVLTTVPMAFVGVALGLFVSANPLSLFTLYGAIALAGIAANDAIVLIATANRRLDSGGSPAQAVVLAARRRVVPILITSLTTIAGLLSLALGLGGKSLIWGPLATAIVWGLAFSTLLTLFVVPLSYQALVKPRGIKDPINEIMARLMPPRRHHWGSALLLFSRKFFGRPTDPDSNLLDVLANPEYRAQFELGIRSLQEGDAEKAIRSFELLANEEQTVAAFNLYAAQANLLMIQEIGWDIGYVERGRKYLARAKPSAPGDHRVALLDKAFSTLGLKP